MKSRGDAGMAEAGRENIDPPFATDDEVVGILLVHVKR